MTWREQARWQRHVWSTCIVIVQRMRKLRCEVRYLGTILPIEGQFQQWRYLETTAFLHRVEIVWVSMHTNMRPQNLSKNAARKIKLGTVPKLIQSVEFDDENAKTLHQLI